MYVAVSINVYVLLGHIINIYIYNISQLRIIIFKIFRLSKSCIHSPPCPVPVEIWVCLGHKVEKMYP